MKKKFILAIDQGTTSSRSVLFDSKGKIVSKSQKEFKQIFPKPGWVEHDPNEIWKTQYQTITDVIKKAKISYDSIESIGITNQRETVVVWDKKTGEPVYNAIVWQDRRTATTCDLIKKDKKIERYIRKNTGLVIDSYFSATKIQWILNNVKKAKSLANKKQLAAGTIDSWLLWKLTKGTVFATDPSNASRTMLYNISKLSWDKKICTYFEINSDILPEVKPSSGVFGYTDPSLFKKIKIPISGIAGDQQAALFGQTCFKESETKNTYGTGCFMLMNTGNKIVHSKHGLLTTIAWDIDGETTYALEGSVFVGGAAIQWLRDGLKLISHAEETEKISYNAEPNADLMVVPAFTGLGAPYWDSYARGMIIGITRDTTSHQIVRATVESIAYQTLDIIKAMEKDAQLIIKKLKTDGGASNNNYLMQFQSDILNIDVVRAEVVETTALGAAYLAGLATGFYSKNELVNQNKKSKFFEPKMSDSNRNKLLKNWARAVERAKNWIQ